MIRRLSSICLILFLPFAALVIACSDDNDNGGTSGAATPAITASAEAQEVEQSVRSAIEAYQDQDMAAFLSYWTDLGLRSEFDATREELQAAGDEFFEGPPLAVGNIANTNIAGPVATTEADLA